MTYRFDRSKPTPNFATIVDFALAGYFAKFVELSKADSDQLWKWSSAAAQWCSVWSATADLDQCDCPN